MDLWDNVKGFYKEKFDIEPEIVELFCDFSVLLLCVSGSSNKSIANFLDMDIEEVRNINKKYIGFFGFDEDLPINPIRQYREDKLSYWDRNYDLLRICGRFEELEKLLNDNWI
jgi:hypothetical protein